MDISVPSWINVARKPPALHRNSQPGPSKQGQHERSAQEEGTLWPDASVPRSRSRSCGGSPANEHMSEDKKKDFSSWRDDHQNNSRHKCRSRLPYRSRRRLRSRSQSRHQRSHSRHRGCSRNSSHSHSSRRYRSSRWSRSRSRTRSQSRPRSHRRRLRSHFHTC